MNANRSDAGPGPSREEPSIDLLILDQPALSFKPREQQRTFQRAPAQQQRSVSPVAQAPQQQLNQQPPVHSISGTLPVKRSFDNEIVDDNTRIFTSPTQLAKVQATPIKEDFDDDEFDKPKRTGSSLGIMAIAVLLSAGVSALITLSLTQNIGKGFNSAVAALEGKMTEAGAKLNQRIETLSLKVDNMQANIAAHPTVASGEDAQVKTLPVKSVSKKAMKPAKPMAVKTAKKSASRRAALAPSKNRKTASEMIQETSTSANMSEANSVSSTTPQSMSTPAAESTGEIAKSPSAAIESTPSASAEPSSPPTASEPASPSTQSGGVWESNSSTSTEGSGQ